MHRKEQVRHPGNRWDTVNNRWDAQERAGETCRKQLVRCSVNSRWNTSHLTSLLGLFWKEKMSHSFCLLCVLSLSLSFFCLLSLPSFCLLSLPLSVIFFQCQLCLHVLSSLSVPLSVTFCQCQLLYLHVLSSLPAFFSHILSVSALSACSLFSLCLCQSHSVSGSFSICMFCSLWCCQ